MDQLVVFDALPQGIIPLYTYYFPSLVEFIIGAAVIAFGLLAFSLGVRYLKVVDHTPTAAEQIEVEVPEPTTVAGTTTAYITG